MAFLKVLESPDPALKDQTIPITGKEILIGRGKENTLVLEDHAVSRHHARIVEEPEGHLLVDNNRANGSWVNGQRVTEVRLKPGDQIRLGKSLFEIQGVYDPEGTALLDVQGMGIPVKTAPTPSPVAPAPPPAPVAAAAPPPPAPRPAPPAFEPPTTPEPVPMRRPAPPPAPIAPPPPVAARPAAPMPPPAPAPAARPTPMPPPARVAAPPPPAYAEEGAIEGEPAGFWIRFVAYLIDSIIVTLLMAVIWAPSVFFTIRAATSAEGPGPLATILPFLSFLLGTAVALGYILWFWANRGATPGKKMLGLKIVREDGEDPIGWGTAFMRLVGYMVSGFVLYIGFLMIAFNAEKKGLHDMIAKTRVLKVR